MALTQLPGEAYAPDRSPEPNMRALPLVCLASALSLSAQETRSFGQEAQDIYPSSRPAEQPRRPQQQPQRPQPQPQQPPAEDMQAQAPAMDQHFLQKTEYLITLREYKGGSGWVHVYIARMLTPASTQTKGEAEFFIINADKKGQKVWTKFFQLTRPATKADLQLGTLAYALDANSNSESVYTGPRNREDNLHSAWFLGTINDDSELYKGYVMLSGYKVKPSALRVATQPQQSQPE